MNKYSIEEIQIGDLFINVNDFGVYKLLSYENKKYRGNFEWQYKFLEIQSGQEWIHSRKWFMRNLKPAPITARVLYGE